MKIGGITPVTTIDYPEHVSCVLFIQGCPLRCRFCHNIHLTDFSVPQNYSDEYVLQFLDERKNFCEAVVLSGGEPYSQPDIIEFIKVIKAMGYKVAVHTAGYYKERFVDSLKHVDWVGFDIKCVPEDYPILTGVSCGEIAFKSLESLISSGVDYEVRTTVDPYYFTEERVSKLLDLLLCYGVTNYVLQEYRDIKDDEQHKFFHEIVTDQVVDKFSNKFKNFSIRRAHE